MAPELMRPRSPFAFEVGKTLIIGFHLAEIVEAVAGSLGVMYGSPLEQIIGAQRQRALQAAVEGVEHRVSKCKEKSSSDDCPTSVADQEQTHQTGRPQQFPCSSKET